MYIVAEKARSGIAKTTVRAFSTIETLVQFLSDYRDSKVRQAHQHSETYPSGHFLAAYQALSRQTLREWFICSEDVTRYHSPFRQLEILSLEQDLPINLTNRPNSKVTLSTLLELTANMDLDYLPRT
jgi:hypothetical protein